MASALTSRWFIASRACTPSATQVMASALTSRRRIAGRACTPSATLAMASALTSRWRVASRACTPSATTQRSERLPEQVAATTVEAGRPLWMRSYSRPLGRERGCGGSSGRRESMELMTANGLLTALSWTATAAWRMHRRQRLGRRQLRLRRRDDGAEDGLAEARGRGTWRGTAGARTWAASAWRRTRRYSCRARASPPRRWTIVLSVFKAERLRWEKITA
jgi:hypothetical protein